MEKKQLEEKKKRIGGGGRRAVLGSAHLLEVFRLLNE